MLSASGNTSTVSATTTGTILAIVSGLNVTVKLSAPSTSGLPIQILIGSTVVGNGATDSKYSLIGLSSGFTFTLPHWGTQYAVSVQVINNMGTSSQSYSGIGSAVFSTPAYVPGAPVISTVVPGQSQITLNWTAVPNASSYNVYLNGTLKINTTGLSYIITGLSPATTYTVGVQAVAPDVV